MKALKKLREMHNTVCDRGERGERIKIILIEFERIQNYRWNKIRKKIFFFPKYLGVSNILQLKLMCEHVSKINATFTFLI